MKPFRFGVNAWSAESRAGWTDKARKAEDLGYSTLTVPDHLAGIFAPMPALMSAAAATTRLRVGTNVLNNDLRHPVPVAREAATADLLTDGRLQLGLGAGHMKSEYDQAGLSFEPGAARVERLAEAVAIVKGLLRGEEVSFAGRHYRVERHTIHPRPGGRPRTSRGAGRSSTPRRSWTPPTRCSAPSTSRSTTSGSAASGGTSRTTSSSSATWTSSRPWWRGSPAGRGRPRIGERYRRFWNSGVQCSRRRSTRSIRKTSRTPTAPSTVRATNMSVAFRVDSATTMM